MSHKDLDRKQDNNTKKPCLSHRDIKTEKQSITSKKRQS